MSKNSQTHADLLRVKQGLEDRRKFIAFQLESIDRKLAAVSETLILLDEPEEASAAPQPIAAYVFPPQQLRGLTHIQALERIAKANSGRLKITTAKEVLVAAGLISTPKNAYSIISNDIKRSEQYHQTGPGEYQLKDFHAGDKLLLADTASK